MIKKTSITTDRTTLKLLKRIAQEDKRSASATISILVQEEARRRGWLNGNHRAGNATPDLLPPKG